MHKIQKDIKLNIRQVDVSKDVNIIKNSEEQLFEYIETLKGAISHLSFALLDQMHPTLKQFGNQLKLTKKENKKATKEVAKTYKNSAKKAQKAKANNSDEPYDQKTQIAIEREKADLGVYKFYVDLACKNFQKDIKKVYKNCDRVLKGKVKLKATMKDRGRKLTPEKKVRAKSSKQKSKGEVSTEDLTKGIDEENKVQLLPLKKCPTSKQSSPALLTHSALTKSPPKAQDPSQTPKFVDNEIESAHESSIKGEEEDTDAEGDEELLKMLENDAKTNLLPLPNTSLPEQQRKSIQIERQTEMQEKLKEFIGHSFDTILQIQNFVTKK